MLAALSGCQKDLVAPNDFTPISRFEAEQLLKGWNAERKGTLKSAATITLSEKQWQKAKVYMNDSAQISVIAVPLLKRLALCFEKNRSLSELYFCETRPDSSYLANTNGRIYAKSFSGYLIFYNDKGKGVAAYRYEQGLYQGEYEVIPKRTILKGVSDMNYLEEVVCTATRIHRTAEFFTPHNEDPIGTPRGADPKYETILIGNDDSPSTYPTPEPKIEDDSLKKNPCAQFAWDKLNSSSTSFRSLIEPFLGQKSTLNITFDVGKSMDPDVLGSAYPPVNGWVNIVINSDAASSESSLLTASVFCHEILHAEIWRILQVNHYDMTACKDDYAALWRNWEKYYYEYNSSAKTHHGTMADAYTDLIVKMLTEFDRSQGITNRYPMIYEALAWSGLYNTDEWKELPAMCQEKYQSLLNAQKNVGGCGK